MGINHESASGSIMRSRRRTARRSALLMIAALLIGACSAAGPTAAEPGGSETPPSPVLTLTDSGDTTVTVSWTAPDTNLAVSGYELRWRRAGDSIWIVVGNISPSDTSYNITDLNPDTAYVVQVLAVFSDGRGEWSQPPLPVMTGSTTTEPTMGAPAPSELTVGPTVGPTSVTVTWTPPQTTLEIQGYELRWRPSSESGWHDVDGITATSHTITDLEPGIEYVVQVRAAFADGFGDWSPPLMLTTSVESGTQSPSTPQTPRPTLSRGPVTHNSVTVTWTPPQTTLEIQGYELRWRPGLGSGWTAVDIPSTDSSYTISSLGPGATYVVEVRAVYASAGGESPWSQVTARTETDPDLPTIRIEAIKSTADEDENQVWFLLLLSKASNTTFLVAVSVIETGAIRLRTNPSSVPIPMRSVIEYFLVGIREPDDATEEPDSVIMVTIQPGTGYNVGAPASASVTVLDND